jgi:uncharacterized protein (DUF983 family)
MRPTPFGRLLARALRARCPICARGSLYRGLYALRDYCPLCGFRFRRAVEYGGGGYLSGAVSLNVLITGAVPLAALVYLAATRAAVPVAVQLAVAVLWALIFPLLFHRVACALWLAIDLRLNPPAPHELAAAPPRGEASR